MPGRLIILCNVERVPALDSAEKDQLGFGMNLAVAWDRDVPLPAGEEFDERLLQPWRWPAIHQVTARWSRKGVLEAPMTCAVIDRLAAASETMRDAMLRQYNIIKDPPDHENLRWPPAIPNGQTDADARVVRGSAQRRPWPVFLLNTATASGVLSRQLHLTVSFCCPAPTDLAEQTLIAAPVLRDGFLPPDQEAIFVGGRQPDTTQAPVPRPHFEGLMAWPYTAAPTAADPAIHACTMPCAVDVRSDASNPAIDLKTQWVVTGRVAGKAQRTVAYEDWEANLPARAAEGFRQDRFLRDYMHSGSSSEFAMDEQRWQILDRALLALRDRAGAGLSPGTNGRRAAAVLLERGPVADRVELTPEQWKALDIAYRNAFAEVADWTAFLRDQVPGAKALRILGSSAEKYPPIGDTQVAAEYSRLLEMLDDPRPVSDGVTDGVSAMWRLFLGVWTKMLLQPSLTEIDEALRKRILARLEEESREAGKLERTELLSLLNDELLGRFWTDFLRSNKEPAASDPFGGALIDRCYAAYALYYARLRWGVTPLDAPAACIPNPANLVELPAQPPVFTPAVPTLPLTKAASDQLEAFFCQWIVRSRETLRPTRPSVTRTPPPLTFQIAPLGADTERASKPTSDLLREFAGFGVLMRERSKQSTGSAARPWRCLNLAALHLSDNPDAAVHPDALVVPYRLHYQGERRQVCATYDNQSIVADSPLATPRIAGVQLEARAAVDQKGVFTYRYTPAARMPGLKFGSQYDVAVFTISNTGILPRAITAHAKVPAFQLPPTITLTDKDEDDLIKLGVIQEAIPYQRTVPVGELRLCGEGKRADGGDTPIALPPIPPTVAPLTVELLSTLLGSVVKPGASTAAAAAAGKPGGKPAKPAVTATSTGGQPPLILLSPDEWRTGDTPGAASGMSSTRFSVRLPQVTWSCHDRWNADVATPQQRAAIIAEVHRRHSESHARPDTRAPELCLDDPAVSRLLHLELSVEEDETLRLVDEAFIEVSGPEIEPGAAVDPLTALNAGRARVTCEWLARGQPDVFGRLAGDIAGSLATLASVTPKKPIPPSMAKLFKENVSTNADAFIQIREGRIYRLTVSACVPESAVHDTTRLLPRFDDVVLKPNGTAPPIVRRTENGDERDYLLMSRSHVLLEAATTDLPEEDELFAACKPRFECGARGMQRFRVELRPRDGDATSLARFRYVQRADIDRQAWRWQGRPTGLHPHLKTRAPGTGEKELGEDVRRWVVEEFGERADNICTTDGMTAFPLTRTTGNTPRPVPGVRTFIFDDLLQQGSARHDMRGHHFRCSVKVFSRYAALMRGDQRERYARTQVSASGTLIKTRWHEVFVPSRRLPPIDPPRVKLILPLTQAFDEDVKGSPGLLVVLNEPWFEAAGLGEALSVEIGQATSPWDDERTPSHKTYLEMGPDPILQAYKQGNTAPPYSEPRTPDAWENDVRIGDSDTQPDASDKLPPRASIAGPVGHYFDRNNNSALFVGSSFIVPAPFDPDDKSSGANSGWYFARLRFRRKVVCREMRASIDEKSREVVAYAPDEKTWPLRTYYSPPSDDFWVQYLPPFSISDGRIDGLTNLTPRLDFKAKTLRLVNAAGMPEEISPTKSDKNMFRLYAVLTRVVFDAATNKSEAYLTVFEQGPDKSTWTTDRDLSGIKDEDGAEYRVRVVEVQIAAPGPKPAGSACTATTPKPSELWRWLFPDRPPTAQVRPGQFQPCDAPGRIVRVSAPVGANAPAQGRRQGTQP